MKQQPEQHFLNMFHTLYVPTTIAKLSEAHESFLKYPDNGL